MKPNRAKSYKYRQSLTCFTPILPRENVKKTGFLMFAGGVEMEHWREMGFLFIRDDITRKFNIPRLSNKINFLKKP